MCLINQRNIFLTPPLLRIPCEGRSGQGLQVPGASPLPVGHNLSSSATLRATELLPIYLSRFICHLCSSLTNPCLESHGLTCCALNSCNISATVPLLKLYPFSPPSTPRTSHTVLADSSFHAQPKCHFFQEAHTNTYSHFLFLHLLVAESGVCKWPGALLANTHHG